nr:retrovirus-related Pol polyprotein LINE-1 [Tanacetum cinerariifolium]
MMKEESSSISLDDIEPVELILFQVSECYVYLIPPRKTAASHRADEWDINKWAWEGTLKVVSKGEECIIRLEDKTTGELYARAFLRDGEPHPVEPVIDSSRYFVLRVEENISGRLRHAFIGIGFRERPQAYDFQAALHDHMKYLNKKKTAEEMEQQYQKTSSVDYSLKDGETIVLQLKNVSILIVFYFLFKLEVASGQVSWVTGTTGDCTWDALTCDAQVCGNYRGIKLLSHTMKLWERVIERRLRRETTNQFGFMSGRSSIEAIHLIRSLMEKFRERQRDLHLAFLDLEKAYDSVPRELIWKTLVDKGTSRRYIKVIKDMYDGARTRGRTPMGNTDVVPVEVGLHQGSAISPYLFALILDELSRGIQEDIPWCLIFADDIALVSESAEGLNNIFENLREALEDNGLRVSREKTEYLRCDLGKVEIAHNDEVDIRIGDKILQPKESFRYLGSMIHKSGRIDEDVSHRIKSAWLKWRAVESGYRKCWPITKALANRMEVAELRMLRWTCGKTMLDMIPNGVYRAELEVETIINKMREGRLRWFGHKGGRSVRSKFFEQGLDEKEKGKNSITSILPPPPPSPSLSPPVNAVKTPLDSPSRLSLDGSPKDSFSTAFDKQSTEPDSVEKQSAQDVADDDFGDFQAA